MRAAHILTGVIFLAACSTELPHNAPFDPNAPLEKQAKARLTGTIRLEGETDFSQVTVDLQNEARTYNVDTAANGGVSLTGVVPGTYTLSLRTRYFQAVTETLTVGMGESVKLGTRILSPLRGRVLGFATSQTATGSGLVDRGGVNLSLKKTASIRVAIASSPAFRAAAAKAATGPTLRTVSGTDGNYEFGEVPAGGYRLYASTPENGERLVGDVTVTGEGDVVVDPIVLQPLSGFFTITGTAGGAPSETYTNVSNVTLQMSPSSAALQMRIAESGDGTHADCDLTAASVETVSSTRSLILSSQGQKLVCVSFVDADEKETEPIYGTIMYDAAPPTQPSVQVNAGAAVIKSEIVTLNLSAVDVTSGVSVYKVNTVNSFGSVEPKPFQQTDVFTFGSGDGAKTVWVRIGDRAGLYSAPVSATVLLDTTAPNPGTVAVTKLDGTPLATGATVTENKVLFSSSVTDLSNLEMQITTNGSYSGAVWIPYEPSKIIDLTTAAPSISVRVRDGAELVTDLLTAFDLTVDTVAPTLTFTRTSPSPTNGLTVDLALSSSEAGQAQVSEDPGFAGATWLTTGNTLLVLPAGDGLRTIFARARDAAGNISVMKQISVQIDATPPSSASLIVNAGATYTKVPGITLAIGGLGATEMQVSENNAFAGAGWSAFSTSYAHTITGGQGQTYLYLRLRDTAGNYSGSVSSAVMLDSQAPTSASIGIAEQPKTRQSYVTLTLSAVGAVELMLADDSSFGGRAWQPVTATTQWTLTPGDGTKRVYVKYRDAAGNESTPASAVTILDTAAPVAGSLMLNGGAAITSSTVVAYAIAATDALSEPLQVQVSGEPSFGGAVWMAYSPAGTQPITPGDGVRSLYIRFRDAVGNVSLASSGSFILDQTGPQIASFIVNEGRVFATASVFVDFQVGNWAAGDMVQVATNADFSGAVDYPSNAGVNRVSYTLAAPDGAKTVYARAKDTLGNFGPAWSTTITRDTAPPTLTGTKAIVLAGDADFTTTRFVNLNMNVADATEMLLWNSGELLYATWEPFSASTVWALPFGDGAHTVQARFRDAARNVIQPFSDMITLDTAAPTSPGIVINTGSGYATSVTVALALSAVGATGMQLSGDGVFDTEPLIAYATSDSWTFSSTEGLKTVYARFCDTAGNCSQVVSATVILDRTLPNGSLMVNQGAARTASSTVTLNLSASDGVSGLQGIKLANNSAALAATDVVTFEATKIWTLAAPTGAGVESTKEIWLQVVDRAGLASAPVSDVIVFDTLLPTGGITLATAVTRDTLVGVDLIYTADTTHYKVSSGNACAGGNWVEASPQSVFTLPGIDGAHDVSVRFRDGVMNESDCYVDTVTLDRLGPTPLTFAVTGNAGAQAGYSDSPNLTFDASTAAGDCAYAEIAEDVGFITPTDTSLPCSLAAAAYTLASSSDGFHSVYLRFFDTLGNAGPVAGATIVLDSADPQVTVAGGFTIAQGVYTNDPDITLQFDAAGATRVAYGEGAGCGFTPSVYASAKSLALTGSDGPKPVSVQYFDDAGNASACYARTVTLDTNIDSFSVSLQGADGNTGTTASQAVAVTVVGIDPLDVVEMRISNLASFTGASWEPIQSPFGWLLPSGDGTKNLFVEVRDRAGNVIDASGGIVLDQTPPNSPALQLLDIDADGFPLSATAVELQWSLPSGAATFELQRFVNGIDADFLTLSMLPSTTTQYRDAVTYSGSKYNYRIRARDAVGNDSDWSIVAIAQPFSPIEAIRWNFTDDGYHFAFPPNMGTFSLRSKVTYSNDAEEPFVEQLADGITSWFAYATGVTHINQQVEIVQSNQDNTLVYESSFSLLGQYRARVDYFSDMGYYADIVTDSDGASYISYLSDDVNSFQSSLKFATNRDGVWTTETVVYPSGPFTYEGAHSSIALDAQRNVYISYIDSAGLIVLAVRTDSGWTFSNSGIAGTRTAICVDSAAKAHIAYRNSGGRLGYLNNTAGWVAAALDTTTTVHSSGFISMVIDADDDLHIAYRNNTNNYLKYATNALGPWTLKAIDLSGGIGLQGGIAVDARKRVYIAYAKTELMLATNESGLWQLQNLGATGASNASISVDRHGRKAIVYQQTGGLRLATNFNASWVHRPLDTSAASVGADTAIAISPDGRTANIAYRDVTNIDLKHIRLDMGLGVELPHQTPNAIHGRNSSLVVDADGVRHVVYQDASGVDFLTYANDATGIWNSLTIDPVGGTTDSMSLAVDSARKLHVIFNRGTKRVYANNVTGPWNFLTMGNRVDFPKIAVDRFDKLHIAYGAVGNLYYANNVYGIWITEPADSTPSYLGSFGVDLVVDANQKAHIVYYEDTPTGDLRYSNNVLGAWSHQIIDAEDDTGIYPSLAIDAKGVLHVAYNKYSGAMLYASNPGGVWTRSIVQGASGQSASIALDRAGNPYIAYQGTSALRYSTRIGTQWFHGTLDTSVADPSLVFDENDMAYISYYHSATQKLRVISGLSGQAQAQSVKIRSPF